MASIRRTLRWLALPAAAGLAACGQGAEPRPQQSEQTALPNPAPDSAHDSLPPKRKRGREFLIAHVKHHPVGLRDRPGGRVITKLGATTEFGDPTAVAVVKKRGSWLGVKATQLPNRKVGWIRRGAHGLELSRTKTWLKVDLGRRSLQLRRGSRIVDQVRVGVGTPQSPTPTGTFTVTDKLPGARYGSYYGRFILALSGKQPNTPPGWRGGNRLAIHGTDNPGRIGRKTSAGCVVAPGPALAKLVEEVPEGAPVVIEE
jgi:hypothetical protein